jgi:hypothetical protein
VFRGNTLPARNIVLCDFDRVTASQGVQIWGALVPVLIDLFSLRKIGMDVHRVLSERQEFLFAIADCPGLCIQTFPDGIGPCSRAMDLM